MSAAPTVFEALLDQVAAALAAAPALAGGRLYEGDDLAAVPETDETAVLYSIVRATPSQPWAGYQAPTEWATIVKVTAFARRAQRSATLGRPAWQLAQAAHQRIVNALGADLEPAALEPDHELTATRLGAVDLAYRVTLRTAHNTLTAA